MENWAVLVGGGGERVSSGRGHQEESAPTRIVKVASRFSTGAVALDLWLGISLPLLPAKACLLANRAWPAKGRHRGATPAARGAEDLVAATKTRENMSWYIQDGVVKLAGIKVLLS